MIMSQTIREISFYAIPEKYFFQKSRELTNSVRNRNYVY